MPKKKQEVIGQISELGIVAVVRTETAEQVKGVVNALLEGGVIAIEITFTVPNAVEMIRQTRHEYGDDNSGVVDNGRGNDVSGICRAAAVK